MGRLGYELSRDRLKRTADYYLARTTHDSSLSRVAQAAAFARLDPAKSWRLFCQSLRPDAEPCNSATSEEGLHLSAMAGSIDVIQRHYLGLGFEPDAIKLDPAPPAELGPVRLAFAYRQDNFMLQWTGSALKIAASLSNHARVIVSYRGQRELLAPSAELAYAAD